MGAPSHVSWKEGDEGSRLGLFHDLRLTQIEIYGSCEPRAQSNLSLAHPLFCAPSCLLLKTELFAKFIRVGVTGREVSFVRSIICRVGRKFLRRMQELFSCQATSSSSPPSCNLHWYCMGNGSAEDQYFFELLNRHDVNARTSGGLTGTVCLLLFVPFSHALFNFQYNSLYNTNTQLCT